MSKNNDIIEIDRSDLEILHGALNSAVHQNQVLDLADGYRRLSASPKKSSLTGALEGAYYLAGAYLKEEEEDDESVPE
jgi:hypothetical protein